MIGLIQFTAQTSALKEKGAATRTDELIRHSLDIGVQLGMLGVKQDDFADLSCFQLRSLDVHLDHCREQSPLDV